MTVIPHPLPPSRAGSLPLVGGSLALDFANTESGRGTDWHQNHLCSGQNVADWIAHVPMAPADDIECLRAELSASPERSKNLLASALALRSVIQDIGSAIAADATPSDAALKELSHLHTRFLSRAALVADKRACRWAWSMGASPVEAALGPIALSAVKLITEGDFSRIKRCDGHACGWLFLDSTKNNRRRWCEMEVCGNRAKQKRLAARRRGA
jgi:predicted RNA-binding Zn ribbon-like protein